MRTNLIMHFFCSECGSQLSFAETDQGVEPKRDIHFDQSPKEPTGAACQYASKLRIVPCKFCIEKYTGTAKQLMAAIDGINKLTGKH